MEIRVSARDSSCEIQNLIGPCILTPVVYFDLQMFHLGIGYQAALSLASRGCRVILADKDDSSHARDRIIKETNNPNVLSKRLDLQSFKSVRAFAQDIIDTEPKLHILLNNAGVGVTRLQYTVDGLQKTMQVNYYSHFLLTHLLLGTYFKKVQFHICRSLKLGTFIITVGYFVWFILTFIFWI